MAVTTTKTNKPLNPRGNDQSPKGYNRAALYSGKALDFDGTNDNIVASSFSGLSGEAKASVSLYFNWDSINSGENWFIGQDNPTDRVFAFGYVGSTNELKLQINGTNTTGTGTYDFNTGEWYHYLFTFDTTTNAVVIYVNGQQVATGTQTKDFISATSDLYIGQREYSGNEGRINGKIANVKIFNEVLTAAQVADLYNNPEKIVPTGVADSALKLYLPMMEGAGTTAYDGSGNGNHGTISGATWTHGIGAPVAQTAVIDWNKGTNKAKYSEQFENGYYGRVRISSVTANDTTAPDGQTTADNVLSDTANDQHYVFNSTIALTGQNTISVFAKYNGYNIGIRPQGIGSGQAFANFDLQNGTILGSGGTSYDDSSITSFGDGWYRISMTMDNAASYGFNFYMIDGTTATELPSFTGNSSKGFYLWGAQVNAGATLTPYVRTGATAQTSDVLLPQGLTTGRDITGVNLFENVRKQGALNLDNKSFSTIHDNGSLDITTAISVEAWVYIPNGQASFPMLICKKPINSAYLLFIDTAAQKIMFRVKPSGSYEDVTDTDAFSYNTWIHVVGTMTATNMSLYINGVNKVSTAKTGLTISTTDEELSISHELTNEFNGQIAQPRIYNRALTAEEVQRNYDAHKSIYTNS